VKSVLNTHSQTESRSEHRVARIIGAYGPNQDFDLATASAIPVFIRRAIEYPQLGPFRVLGTG
jgi:hypothetical protein